MKKEGYDWKYKWLSSYCIWIKDSLRFIINISLPLYIFKIYHKKKDLKSSLFRSIFSHWKQSALCLQNGKKIITNHMVKIHVRIVKAMFFPVVMYGCESLTIKKAECWRRIDAFELWCWRRLMRALGTAKRSNQWILKETNPEYSLEGLMLKQKLQ